MNLTDGELKALYERYVNNQCSPEELQLLMNILGDDHSNLSEEKITALFDKTWSETNVAPGYYPLPDLKMPEGPSGEAKIVSLPRRNRHRWWWAAAAIICITTTGLFLYRKPPAPQAVIQRADSAFLIRPGTSGATLTLSDGSKIVLDTASRGTIALQNGAKVNLESGTLAYQQGREGEQPAFNILHTEKGRQFHILLSDGTGVWLNAASTLRYPAAFNGTERVVELTGEAYFEVAKVYMATGGKNGKERMPFKVQIAPQQGRPAQTIEVLGTHFNVNSYEEEPFSKITLVEGSVSVNDLVLKPRQQAIIGNNTSTMVVADVEEALAWKNGYFKFIDEPIESIMRKLERWYNVTVAYEGAKPVEKFNGTISRTREIGEVLDLLQATRAVSLKIQGNRIIVMK